MTPGAYPGVAFPARPDPIHVGLDEVTWPRVATAPEQTGAGQ